MNKHEKQNLLLIYMVFLVFCMQSYGTVNTCTLSLISLIIIDLINVDFYGQFRFMMLVVQVGNRGQRLEHVTYSPVIDQSSYHTSRINGPF